jgi:hypothetical protein
MPDAAVAFAPASRRRHAARDRRGTSPARLNPKGAARAHPCVRMRRPQDVTSTMKTKKLLAVCGACAVSGAPAAVAVAAGGGDPSPLEARSPIAGALARREAQHEVLRLARRKARLEHRRVGRSYPRRVRASSLTRLRAERRDLRHEVRALRRTGGAPDVPVPAALESIAVCESGGDPHSSGAAAPSAASTSSTTAPGRRSAAAATLPPRPRSSRIGAPRCSTRARARRRGRSAGLMVDCAAAVPACARAVMSPTHPRRGPKGHSACGTGWVGAAFPWRSGAAERVQAGAGVGQSAI